MVFGGSTFRWNFKHFQCWNSVRNRWKQFRVRKAGSWDHSEWIKQCCYNWVKIINQGFEEDIQKADLQQMQRKIKRIWCDNIKKGERQWTKER